MSTDARRGIEIEIKLTGAPSSLAAAFRALKGSAPARARTVSTYYDTADSRLWNRGFTLRLRPAGDGHELTLKREERGQLRRGEWTAHTATPVANIGLLPRGAPHAEVGAVLPEELAPRFATDVTREKKRAAIAGAVVEAVLDKGRLAAGGEERALAELELELCDGSTAALLACARTLAGKYALRVETRSKAARARALATGAPPPTSKAARPTLRPGDALESAFRAIVAETAAHVAANVAAAADGRDPEGVHQLRVGLRRLRSLFSLLADRLPPRAAALAEDAKWALRALGPARDLDVFIAETLPPMMEADPDAPGLARLAERAAARTRETGETVRRLVGHRRFNLLLIDLLLLAEGEPALADGAGALGGIAGKALRKRRRKTLAAGRSFAELSNDRRHDVRIAVKKLRYACDYFQALWPGKATAAYLAAMADLQDMLGRLNDATVAARLADEIADGEPEAALGAATLRGWYAHRLRAVDAPMVAAWRKFAATPPFWRSRSGRRA